MYSSSRKIKQIFKRITILLITVIISLSIWIWVDFNLISNLSSELANITNNSASQFFCSQICPQQPFDYFSQCCDYSMNSCSKKINCYNSYIDDLNTKIQQTQAQVKVLMSIGTVGLLFFIVQPFIYCCIRHRQIQEQMRFRADLQRRLIEQREEDIRQNFLGALDMEEILYFLRKNELQNQKNINPRIKSSFLTEDDTSCAICIMQLNEQKVLRLNCGHLFHSACVRDWNQANSICPVCRANIYQAVNQNLVERPRQQWQ